MAYSKWNSNSLTAYNNKVVDLLSSLKPEDCTIHIGVSNVKTNMINEGTSAGPCGTCDGSCVGDCFEGCYAVVHGDGIYTASRRNHAENTIMRRADRIAYYTAFFQFAEKKHKHLRLNETGDFECSADLEAVFEVAQKFPSVRVISYTKRLGLLAQVKKLNSLPNVTIHFSLACNRLGMAEAERFGVPVTRISHKLEEVNCPNQLLKVKGKEWHCAMCAERGVGCFAKKDVTFLAH